MSIAQVREPLSLPATLETQLRGFRRRVWTIKTAEAAAAAVSWSCWRFSVPLHSTAFGTHRPGCVSAFGRRR